MRGLVRVPFRTQSDHYHVSRLKFAGTTVLVGRCFNLVGVDSKSVAHLAMEIGEICSECDGLGGIFARIW